MRSSTIRAFISVALAAALTVSAAGAGRAAIQTDPLALYALMKRAFDRGTQGGWTYDDQVYYLGSIFDAGRAYSLVRPDDPNYLAVAQVAVDVATLLHYDPITNDDASVWYMREACEAVLKGDPSRAGEAQAILARLDAGDAGVTALARIAVADAGAIVEEYHGEPETLIAQVDTDARAFNLTKDAAYRSLALERVARPDFPIAKLPDPPGVQVVTWANAAIAGAQGYSEADVAAARAFLHRRAELKEPPIIARVVALPHEERLLMSAPADEYFGRQKISPLGIENELARIGRYLDAGWGTRMTNASLDVADAIEDWQKGYPRDFALPRALLAAYRDFSRVGSPQAQAAADRMKFLLTIEYGDSSQARELLGA